MHRHGSARTERVRPNVLWGKSESGRAHSAGLRHDDGDDIQGTDRAETLSGGIVAEWGGEVSSVFLQADEDFYERSNWAGFWRL